MKSSARRQSPSRVEEVEEIITGLGGPSVFFHADGSPRRNWFEIMLPVTSYDFLAFVYGDEPTCPKNPSFIITVDRLVICQKIYWCLTWQGELIGDPIPVKVT